MQHQAGVANGSHCFLCSLQALHPEPVAVMQHRCCCSTPHFCSCLIVCAMQAAVQPVTMTREEITSYRPAQDPEVDPSEGQAPVPVGPRPPPMTAQDIAAYRSGTDPDFDPVERRGWWEVDLTSGAVHLFWLFGCTTGLVTLCCCSTALADLLWSSACDLLLHQ